MDVRFTLDWRARAKEKTTGSRRLDEGLEVSTLASLFDTLSKKHPDLAPLLEDATHQSDLEIFVNDHPVRPESADALRLRDGDVVNLKVKGPNAG